MIEVPDVPKKGSDTATWVRWALTLVTIIVSAYVTWQSVESAKVSVPQEVKAQLAK